MQEFHKAHPTQGHIQTVEHHLGEQAVGRGDPKMIDYQSEGECEREEEEGTEELVCSTYATTED